MLWNAEIVDGKDSRVVKLMRVPLLYFFFLFRLCDLAFFQKSHSQKQCRRGISYSRGNSLQLSCSLLNVQLIFSWNFKLKLPGKLADILHFIYYLPYPFHMQLLHTYKLTSHLTNNSGVKRFPVLCTRYNTV